MKIKHKKLKNGDEVISLSTFIYGILILLFVFLSIILIFSYGVDTKLGNKFVLNVARVIPLPAASIDWKKFITIDDLNDNILSIQKFYLVNDFSEENLKIDFDTQEGQKKLEIKRKEVLDKMIQDRVIEILAKKRNINLSETEINNAIYEKMNEFATTDDVKSELKKLYNWTLDDFRDKVIIPNLYKTALIQILSSEYDFSGEAREEAKKAKKELDNGKEFKDVVRMYSQGSSKKEDGYLGWIKKDQLIEELRDPLFEQTPLENNKILESSIGFHIIKIENSKLENKEKILELSQIFIPKKIFSDWLSEEMKKMKIMVPLSEFVWNYDKSRVEFNNRDMIDFEKSEESKILKENSLKF